MRRVAIVAALLALVGAAGAAADPPQPLRVLFVGNSLTASNDLPAEVSRLATAAGRRIAYRSVVYAGFNLEDHWNFGDARSALATGDFDVVEDEVGGFEGFVHVDDWVPQRFVTATGPNPLPR